MACAPDVKIEVQAPDLDAVRRSRPDQSPSRIGPHVLDICRLADIVFLGLHGQDGEDGRIQATLDLLVSPIPARLLRAPPSPWIRSPPRR